MDNPLNSSQRIAHHFSYLAPDAGHVLLNAFNSTDAAARAFRQVAVRFQELLRRTAFGGEVGPPNFSLRPPTPIPACAAGTDPTITQR